MRPMSLTEERVDTCHNEIRNKFQTGVLFPTKSPTCPQIWKENKTERISMIGITKIENTKRFAKRSASYRCGLTVDRRARVSIRDSFGSC